MHMQTASIHVLKTDKPKHVSLRVTYDRLDMLQKRAVDVIVDRCRRDPPTASNGIDRHDLFDEPNR